MTPLPATLPWPTIGLRAAVVVGALGAWFWTQTLIGRKATPREGIGDAVHRLTARWHEYLSTHARAANATLITSSLFIDLSGLGLIGAAIFGPSLAPLLAILIVFGLRQICQALCTLPPPPGIIWRDPGCPTLLVTYGVGNDFFFSGHTAIAVLGALEAARFGPAWLAVVAGVVAAGEMLTVLVLRAHYTLDVITGALAAFLGAELAARWAPVIDAWLR